MVLDYITGICAAIQAKHLSSNIGAKGIAKKVAIFLVISVAHVADQYLVDSTDVLRSMTTLFYLSNEGGSGKTVLMKIICGFLMPSKGYVLINGRKLGKDIDFPENTGIIIEAPTFLAHLNAYQNLKNLADIRGIIGPDEIRQSISAVGLDPNSNKKVGKFSLGMRQKLGIAQAIMENPDILILDEPFNGLDKDSVKEMRSLLLSLRDAGKLILLASHNPLDISLLCDSAFEIDRGMLFPFEITKSQNVVE